MTKAIFLKSMLTLLMAASFSCAKKDGVRATQPAGTDLSAPVPQKTVDKKETLSKPASFDGTISVKTSSDTTLSDKISDDTTKVVEIPAATSKPQPEAKEVKKADLKKPVEKKEEVKKAETKKAETKKEEPKADKKINEKPNEKQVTTAQMYKIKVLTEELSSELLNKKNTVVYGSKIMEEQEALVLLKTANEDSYCSLSGKTNLTKGSEVSVVDIQRKLIDKENDIYQTLLTVDGKGEKAIFDCKHTTENFYIEQFTKNFSNYLETYNPENLKIEIADFIHLRTENRTTYSVKIKNLETLMQTADPDKQLVLIAGKLMNYSDSTKLINAGAEKMSCVLASHSDNLDTSKVFVKAGKKMGIDKYPKVIMQTILYRADKDTFFSLDCMMDKATAKWSDLKHVFNEVIDFGILNRPEYNKKFNEVELIQKEINEKK